MNIINKAIVKSIPILPKSFVKYFSKRYVAGTTHPEALQKIKYLNSIKQSATIDILGEHTNCINDCRTITNEYIELLNEINLNKLDCNLSIKPSHIGTDISYSEAFNNFKNILNKAITFKNFLRIDMENSKLTDITINLYNDLHKISDNIGIVIQAYLFRSENDIKNLNSISNIRLCKGIYKESNKIAYQDYNEINQNFIKLLKIALEKGIYVGIATHDEKLILSSIELINKMKIPLDRFEFQYLYGVPMNNMIRTYVNKNFKIRTYIPFGENWYDYSIRRIKENPKIATYVLKNIFAKSI